MVSSGSQHGRNSSADCGNFSDVRSAMRGRGSSGSAPPADPKSHGDVNGKSRGKHDMSAVHGKNMSPAPEKGGKVGGIRRFHRPLANKQPGGRTRVFCPFGFNTRPALKKKGAQTHRYTSTHPPTQAADHGLRAAPVAPRATDRWSPPEPSQGPAPDSPKTARSGGFVKQLGAMNLEIPSKEASSCMVYRLIPG